MNTEERFWSFVGNGECWEWSGTRSHGYGYFTDNETGRRAHRVMWERVFGPIPDGSQVLHRCDNPACVRPDHLFLGSQQDNIRDCVSKDRRWKGGRPILRHRGEWNGNSKLTAEIVDEIRRRYQDGGGTKTALAREYGISKTHIGRILDGTAWPTDLGSLARDDERAAA